MTDKESYVNVADLKRKLRAFAKYRQYSKPATDELLGVVSKLKISIKADLETTLESADVQPVDRWISVKDRLPENCIEVLVYDTDCGIVIGWYDKEIGDFAADFISALDAVTHWQPLPEPPQD